jgi:hypothetical protein
MFNPLIIPSCDMELIAYILFIIIFLVLGILIFIPVRWLVKRKISKTDFEKSDLSLHITSSGLALISFLVVVLLLGFVQEHIAPETLFGRFISTWQGKLYYIVVLCLAFDLFGLILQRLGFTLFKRPDRDD